MPFCLVSTPVSPIRLQLPPNRQPFLPKTLYNAARYGTRRHRPVSAASSRLDSDAGGHPSDIVDANMSVLRKRIQRLREEQVLTDDSFLAVPQHWTRWERDHHAFWQDEIALFIARVHCYLLSRRPAVSLSLLAFTFISVPVASICTLFTVMSWLLSLSAHA